MTREDVTIVNLVYQRNVDDINSFLTVPIELRKEWLDTRLIMGMARTAEEFRNLREWELVCYYHDKIGE